MTKETITTNKGAVRIGVLRVVSSPEQSNQNEKNAKRDLAERQKKFRYMIHSELGIKSKVISRKDKPSEQERKKDRYVISKEFLIKYEGLLAEWQEKNPKENAFLVASREESIEREKVIRGESADRSILRELFHKKVAAEKVIGIEERHHVLIPGAYTIDGIKSVLIAKGESSVDQLAYTLVNLRFGNQLYDKVNAIKSELIQSELRGEVIPVTGEVFNAQKNHDLPTTEPLSNEEKPTVPNPWVAFALS
jgi:hypothetical protein